MPANDRLGPDIEKVQAPVGNDSTDQNPEKPVARLELEATPGSQQHLKLLPQQEILQDEVLPTADCRPSRADDQRKKLKHRRRIAVRPLRYRARLLPSDNTFLVISRELRSLLCDFGVSGATWPLRAREAASTVSDLNQAVRARDSNPFSTGPALGRDGPSLLVARPKPGYGSTTAGTRSAQLQPWPQPRTFRQVAYRRMWSVTN